MTSRHYNYDSDSGTEARESAAQRAVQQAREARAAQSDHRVQIAKALAHDDHTVLLVHAKLDEIEPYRTKRERLQVIQNLISSQGYTHLIAGTRVPFINGEKPCTPEGILTAAMSLHAMIANGSLNLATLHSSMPEAYLLRLWQGRRAAKQNIIAVVAVAKEGDMSVPSTTEAGIFNASGMRGFCCAVNEFLQPGTVFAWRRCTPNPDGSDEWHRPEWDSITGFELSSNSKRKGTIGPICLLDIPLPIEVMMFMISKTMEYKPTDWMQEIAARHDFDAHAKRVNKAAVSGTLELGTTVRARSAGKKTSATSKEAPLQHGQSSDSDSDLDDRKPLKRPQTRKGPNQNQHFGGPGTARNAELPTYGPIKQQMTRMDLRSKSAARGTMM